MKILSAIIVLFCFSITLSAQNSTDNDIRPFAYVTESYNYTLQVVNLNTYESIYTITSAPYMCVISMSPDNRYLLYSDYSDVRQETWYFQLDIVTGEQTNLRQSRILHSEDGRYYALITADEVFIINKQTGQSAQIVQYRGTIGHFWGDNHLFAISRRQGNLQLSRNDGGEVFLSLEISVPDGQRLSSYQVSPNAEYILYSFTSDDSISTSWLAEVATGNHTQMFGNLGREARWSPDSTTIALITHNCTQLTLYDVSTGEISQLVPSSDDSLASHEIRWMQWSPDGQYMLYSDEYTNQHGEKTLRLYLHNFESDTRTIVEDDLRVQHLNFSWLSETEFVYTLAEIVPESPEGSYQTDLILRDAITLEILYQTETEESELLDCGIG